MNLNDLFNEEKVRLDPKCWTGKKIGNPKTKVKGGVRVNNCVPAESVEEGVMYGAENLNVGDDVIISGDVELNGATGVIDSFGQDKRFVVVDLYNHGRHSFHSSDVSANDYDSDEHDDDLAETRVGQVPMTLKPGETDNLEPEDFEGFKKLPAYKQGQQAQQSRGKDLIQQSPYTYQSDQDWAYRNGAFDARQAASSADFAKRGPLTTTEDSLEEIDRRGFLKGMGAAAAGAAGSAKAGVLGFGAIVPVYTDSDPPLPRKVKGSWNYFDPDGLTNDDKNNIVKLINLLYFSRMASEDWRDSQNRKITGIATPNITPSEIYKKCYDLLIFINDSFLNLDFGKVMNEQKSKIEDLYKNNPEQFKKLQEFFFSKWETTVLIGNVLKRKLTPTNESVNQGMAEGEQQKGADYRDPKEVDYDAIDHDKSVARLKHLAGLGPMKTVYDPAKRVYRNMPTAQQPKK